MSDAIKITVLLYGTHNAPVSPVVDGVISPARNCPFISSAGTIILLLLCSDKYKKSIILLQRNILA
jgi:hypothetical protein